MRPLFFFLPFSFHPTTYLGENLFPSLRHNLRHEQLTFFSPSTFSNARSFQQEIIARTEYRVFLSDRILKYFHNFHACFMHYVSKNKFLDESRIEDEYQTSSLPLSYWFLTSPFFLTIVLEPSIVSPHRAKCLRLFFEAIRFEAKIKPLLTARYIIFRNGNGSK